MEQASSRVTQAEVRDALDILRRERDATAPTRIEALMYRWISFIGFKGVLAWALTGAAWIWADEKLSDTSIPDVLVGVFTVMTLGLVAVIVVALPFTLALPLRLLRQWSLVRRFGLASLFASLLGERRRGHRVRSAVTILCAVLFVFATFLTMRSTGTGRNAAAVGVMKLAVIVFVLVPTFTAVLAWLARLWRDREDALSDVQRLRDLLVERSKVQSATNETSVVDVPTDALSQIGRIEQMQISRDRIAALNQAKTSTATGYAVLKTTRARTALDALPLEDRLRTEDRIHDLMDDPERGDARRDDRAMRIPVPDRPLEIAYTVDTRTRRVTVLDVERVGHAPRPRGLASSSRG